MKNVNEIAKQNDIVILLLHIIFRLFICSSVSQIFRYMIYNERKTNGTVLGVIEILCFIGLCACAAFGNLLVHPTTELMDLLVRYM